MISKLRVWVLMATAGVLVAAFVAPAGASRLVEFEQGPAVAFNGPIPPIPAKPLEEVKEACGSETNTWGSELFTTPPSEIKVKNEWADIVAGKEMEISGTVTTVEFSRGDIPTDHPFSDDFTYNVLLDEPYWSLARSLGPGAPEGAGNETEDHEIHLELESGALLHALPQKEGPLSGENWDLLKSEPVEPTLQSEAIENLEPGYIPHSGDRVAMRGRWIIDCGHNDFHSEIHPVTFMAFGHAEAHKTIVHVLSNPYRVTQLYGSGISEFNPSTPKGKPFPEAFEASVTAIVVHSFLSTTPMPLTLEVGVERTNPIPTPFRVCAPEGVVSKVKTQFGFVRRNGVKIKVARGGSCSTVSVATKAKKYTVMAPRARKCNMRWPWLSAKIAEALGTSETRSNEVEEIKVNATGGTYTIKYGAETTGPIPYNATAPQVQTALEALPALTGNVTVTGGPGGSGGKTPYVVTFVGALKETAITPVTTSPTALIGAPKLATVIVLKPGGLLDLRRFILSLIEQKEKVALEEAGDFAAIERIESNMALTPETPCLDPISGPAALHGMPTDNSQPLPFYGQLQVGSKK
jgi:hypothetical protein